MYCILQYRKRKFHPLHKWVINISLSIQKWISSERQWSIVHQNHNSSEVKWLEYILLTSKLSWKSIVMQLLLISSSIVLGIYTETVGLLYYRKLLIIHIKHDVYQTTEPSGIQQYNLGKRPWHKVSHMTFQSMGWIDP